MCNIRADFVRKPGQLQSRRLFSLQLSEPYPVTGEGDKRSKSVKYKTLAFFVSNSPVFATIKKKVNIIFDIRNLSCILPVGMSHCHTHL